MRQTYFPKRRNGVVRAGLMTLLFGLILALAAYIVADSIPYGFHTLQGDIVLFLLVIVVPLGGFSAFLEVSCL